MSDPVLLALYCRSEDFDATQQVCNAPFYGPAPSGLPKLSAVEGAELAALIVGVWAIGFLVKQGRHISST